MKKQPANLDISPEHYQIISAILENQVPAGDVWVFGSRVKGLARPYSDLDLAVAEDGPLGIGKLAELKEHFSESALPWKVDVVDWATASPVFRRAVENSRVLIQQGRQGKKL